MVCALTACLKQRGTIDTNPPVLQPAHSTHPFFHQPLVNPGEGLFARSRHSTHPNIHPLPCLSAPGVRSNSIPRATQALPSVSPNHDTHILQSRCLLLVGVTCKSCMSSNERVEEHSLHFLSCSSSFFCYFNSKPSVHVIMLYVSNWKTVWYFDPQCFPSSVHHHFISHPPTFQLLPRLIVLFFHWPAVCVGSAFSPAAGCVVPTLSTALDL